MSIWTRISDRLSRLAKGEGLAALFERPAKPPEMSVAFTIAVVALGAKIAKADGQVTRNEVAAFREVFRIAPGDEAHAAKVYNLARQDVAGYEEYARRIGRMFGKDDRVLCDLMEGLFYVAMADGDYHPAEDEFLSRVAQQLGIGERNFRSLRARFVHDAEPDPYEVLGVSPDTPIEEIREVWKAEVRETHPDRMQARGLPEEAITLAEKRLRAINAAWEAIREDRG